MKDNVSDTQFKEWNQQYVHRRPIQLHLLNIEKVGVTIFIFLNLKRKFYLNITEHFQTILNTFYIFSELLKITYETDKQPPPATQTKEMETPHKNCTNVKQTFLGNSSHGNSYKEGSKCQICGKVMSKY